LIDRSFFLFPELFHVKQTTFYLYRILAIILQNQYIKCIRLHN